MTRFRVFAKRPSPLTDSNLIVLLDYKVPFDIDILQQVDDETPTLVQRHNFNPDSIKPVPPVVEGDTIWCSNEHGKWDNGKQRTVTKSEGDISADGKGIFMAASGKPKLAIAGDGSAELQCEAGHGRFYICATNYNSVLDLEFNLKTPTVDNLSLKSRSRHQAGGDAANRFGGFGSSISLDEVGSKTEAYHNMHENSKSASLKRKLKNGAWYKARFEVKNIESDKKVQYTTWLDYNDGNGLVQVLQQIHPKPKDYYMNKDLFKKESWVWIRMNNEKAGVIGLRNLKLKAI